MRFDRRRRPGLRISKNCGRTTCSTNKMDRRDLLKGLAALPLLSGIANAAHTSTAAKIVRPKRLKAGQTVALISPSSGLSMNEINKAIDNMNSLGLKSKLGKYADKTN